MKNCVLYCINFLSIYLVLYVFYPFLVKIVTSKRKHNWLIFSYLEKERKWCSGKDKFLDGPKTAETVTTTNWRTFSKILIFSSKLQFQYSFYNSTSIYIEYVAINAFLWTKYKYFMQNSIKYTKTKNWLGCFSNKNHVLTKKYIHQI